MRIHAARWADHGDSGALVFARTPLPGSDVKPAIGLHFAGEEGSSSFGIACRISEVYRALGLTSLADGALALALAAIPLDETHAEQAATVLRDLFARVPRDGATRALHQVLTKHRALTTELIVRDDGELRQAVAKVLRFVVGRGQTLADARNTQLDAPLVSAIRECCERFAERGRSNDFHDAVIAVRDLMVTKQGHRLEEALAITDEPLEVVDDPQPSRRAATLQDVIAYLTEFRSELVDKYDAIGVGEYQSSESRFGIDIALERGRERTIKIPRFVDWSHDGRDVRIPIRVTRQGAAMRK
jgi:hypothetical protein